MIIDMVRHGQTDWNIQWRMQWSQNTSLNETWQLQATKLSVRLKDESYDTIYVSGLNRAIETMEEIKKHHSDTAVIIDSTLNERSGWDFEWSIESSVNWDDIPWNALEKRPPNWESISDHIERSKQFLERISTLQQDQILIVCHWGTLECIISLITSKKVTDIHPKNTAFYRFERKWDKYIILVENSDSHLLGN